MHYRQLLPKSVKLSWQLFKRRAADRKSGKDQKWAKKAENHTNFEAKAVFSIEQPIRSNPFLANKVHNLCLAIAEIEQVVVYPGQVFSFWQIVGPPTRKRDYREGRNLINGVLKHDVGGGLCQLSGILYHTALVAGLKIVERHNHSVDFYEENERITPLGADATVAYGYKDLRFENGYDFAIRFRFELADDRLVCRLESPVFIEKKSVSFDIKSVDNQRVVKTYLEGYQVAESVYRVG
jgi:vancomycin resistance protein VanW